MIYLFYGSDVEKVRTKAFAWVAAARAKEPNLVYARLSKEEITEAALLDAAQSGGLFVKRLLVVLDDPFSRTTRTDADETRTGAEDTGSAVEEQIDVLVKSDNAIVIIAPRLASAKAKKMLAGATKAYEFNAPVKEKRGFNVALVNALAARDSKKLWLEIMRALRAGDAPEMIHGLLHWKARDIMAKGSRVYSPKEAHALSLSLIALLQDSRRKGLESGETLERYALSIAQGQ